MLITLDRCTLRSWRPSDAEHLATIANDRSVSIMLRDRFPFPYTRADADDYIARASAEQPETSGAITIDDVVVGGIGYQRGEDIYRLTAEIGYWLGAQARGRGLATEALRGFVAWIWATTDLQFLHASVFTNNPASARVLDKCGFTLTHRARNAAIKEGILHDEWKFEMVRLPPPSITADPGPENK